MTHIGAGAFNYCEGLGQLVLPAALQAVDSYAFFSCAALEEITFPASLTYIGKNAFSFCGNLAAVRFMGEVPLMSAESFESGPDDRQFSVPEEEAASYEALLGQPCQPVGKCVYLDHTAQAELLRFDPQSGEITGYLGLEAGLLLPDAVDGVPVRGIAARAFFANPWLRRVWFPDTVTVIGKEAFSGTKVAQAVFPVRWSASRMRPFLVCRWN